MRTPTAHGPDGTLPDHLTEHLTEWVTRDLLTAAEAEGIRAYEVTRAAPSRGPALAEVIGYVGAALVLAAGSSVYGQRFDDISHSMRVAVPAIVAVVALLVGIPFVRRTQPTFQRLGAVLWLLSVGLLAAAVTVAMVDAETVRSYALFVIGAVTLAYAGVLYWFLRAVTTQFAFLAGIVATIIGAVVWVEPSGPNAEAWAVLPLVALGLGWVALGGTGWIMPRTTALVLGTVLALWVPQFLMLTGIMWAPYVVGLGVSVALLFASTWLHSSAVLALSAIGLFVYLVATIMEYLADTLGTAVALLLSGIVLLAIALGASRLRRFTQAG
jgi:hypothetical protein